MKPILFNTDMVQAILEGRKTVTRRIVKPQNAVDFDNIVPLKPPYNDGDILYVRETWMQFDKDHIIDGVKYAYKADCSGESERIRYEYGYRWKPSIHMPKEAARIFLRVKDIRVERLQQIDINGMRAEGIYDDYKTTSEEYHEMLCKVAYQKVFEELWNSTIENKYVNQYGWDANPWVWVIEFERISREEDIK